MTGMTMAEARCTTPAAPVSHGCEGDPMRDQAPEVFPPENRPANAEKPPTTEEKSPTNSEFALKYEEKSLAS
jgi:hypothetical protein